jgi:hypothetical protein
MTNHHILAGLASERHNTLLTQAKAARLAKQATLSRRHGRRRG